MIYKTYLSFVEGEDIENLDQYPLIYRYMKEVLNIGLSPDQEKQVWSEVKESPYTWDIARAALKKWEEAGCTVSKDFNDLKAMDYGHRCCREVFVMWGLDTTRVKKILSLA